ncbi:purine-nucleoside phosphorylase [Engelhardtia mirabilis]|uniref:Purine nucleoside phosphorylase n=1 Tax=Engelhardtia mirabilis TaxID=2528011 RepID=A0A518BDJ8_9BACT|nr:Purine nucleoside phosphorylase 1 [Planctomycetes bacterium Pla133]QDU99371.1 Purine nucleoside phosphorylase 1 [Planctomycetes bacterium Pla86]
MTITKTLERARAVADGLRARGVAMPDVALVLGSGLGAFAEQLEAAQRIDYGELEGLPTSAVPGHAGCFTVGRLGGVTVLCQSGRVHLYEGWSPHDVTVAVRAIAQLGCRALVLTNAAGGLRPEWEPGTLMRIEDHLNLQGTTPLERTEAGVGSPWSQELGTELDVVAAELGVPLRRGVYAALPGPSYETPAEVRALAGFGADAVGMSTALEALAASAAGMQVCGISCITNHAAGITDAALNHAEVVEVGRRTAGLFARLLSNALPRLARVAG